MEEWLGHVKEVEGMSEKLAESYFDDQVNDLLHAKAINENKRPDGRGFDDVRPLFAEAGGLSPVLHGTGVFYRGGTHVLSVLTLGGPQDSQILEGMEVQGKKRYMHHYNFPPFSSGETGRMGGMNRRAIGHGALAEKALMSVLPEKEVFPYTIRIVSESMASNGSTSMASVCGSTLALMDAGVPITEPVAGIASGLMMESATKYKVLTDIQGPEDHHGDMDFKVAGTKNGVTAIQMDVKVGGIPLPILSEAFAKAKAARLTILETMKAAIEAPRADISPYAPKIVVLKIKPDQIGMVIGSGGKTVNEIREQSGAEIDIEDDGTVFCTGKNGSAEKARDIIAEMTHEYQPGEMFKGVVTRLMDFGAFVKIGHSAEGLVHVSEIASFRIDRVADYIKEGMEVPVVVKEVDEKGRINLSIKRADANFIKPNEHDAKVISEHRGGDSGPAPKKFVPTPKPGV
jgi:polyribonucleotide nucleotidyltransferase